MEKHITATFPDTNPAIQNFVWSDGAWVSFNADTKEWAHHGTIPHPTANPSRFGAPQSRRATDALEVVPLADAPKYPTAWLEGSLYRVRDGVLEARDCDGDWFTSNYTLADLYRIDAPKALIAALTAEPPRHSAECADAD